MKIGDLVRIKNCCSSNDDSGVGGYLLEVTQKLDHGIYIIIIEGPWIGEEHYLPYAGRELEVISESR